MNMEAKTIALVDLEVCNFRRLASSLQKEDAWRKVAEFVQIFDQNEIASLSAATCPAERLLNELGTKLCTLETLGIILRNCGLYEALALISEPEPMQIVHQPTSILEGKNRLSIPIGEELRLQFEVSGIPMPKYQWFKDDQILIDQIASVLHYDRYSPDMEGEYVCCAMQETPSSITSEPVQIKTLPIRCEVLEKPDKLIYLCEGSPIFLKVRVRGYPKPSFQWLHENETLQNENKDVLFIKNAKTNHSGNYRCFISNRVSELTIKTTIVIYTENIFEVYKNPVSDKIALLIANDDYENLESLSSPSNDVSTISAILRTLGFKTICLLNLNLHELKVAIELFANLVNDDCFAFFYYAGHGFEMGDRFLSPIDSPNANDFRKGDALPESMILQKILNRRPILFVLLLDMCLKLPDRLENPAVYEEAFEPYPFESNRNLIRGYSTTSHLVSYERTGSTNGIYVNSLRKYLGDNLPVLTILGKVNAEIAAKCPEQMPNISYITAQDFYLNNAVKGFYNDDNKNYLALNIKDQTTIVGGTRIRLSKFRGFNNVLEIVVLDAETVEYSTKLVVKEMVDRNEVHLRVSELQRMGEISFDIELKINGVDFVISKRFEIANIFLDV